MLYLIPHLWKIEGTEYHKHNTHPFQGQIVKQGKFADVAKAINLEAVVEEDEDVRTEKRKQSEMRRISRRETVFNK